MIPFAAYIQGLGLSQAEAAHYLGVRTDTLASWCKGRRTPAPAAVQELHGLAVRQAEMAAALVDAFREAVRAAGGDLPEYASLPDLDDAAAAELGMPNAESYRAVIRRAWEMMPPGTVIRLVDAGDQSLSAARRLRSLMGAAQKNTS